jgi:bifunctional aspartokinase / homoserine dehydrogenase 1
MLVCKFGGTSVGSADRFAATVDVIATRLGQPLVIVISAMSKTTSALIEGARAAADGRVKVYQTTRDELESRHVNTIKELLPAGPDRENLVEAIRDRLLNYARLCASISTLGEYTMRGNDAVASVGEELSSRILAAVLRARGIPSEAISATEIVETDDRYGSAAPDMGATERKARSRLLPLLAHGTVPVVTGYIGATTQGVTTTLGRGGSDYSAAILGAALDAETVEIWTDVSGILTADPKLVPEATILRELSYEEAAELAYFGADVLHPKTIAPVAERRIRLAILNSFRPEDPGTAVVAEPSDGRAIAPAILSTEGLCLIRLSGNGRGWTLQMASRALRRLDEDGVDVLMFSQSFTERSLNLVVRASDEEHGLRLLSREFEHDARAGLLADIATHQQVASVSVVGMPRSRAAEVTSTAFASLGALGQRVIAVAQATTGGSVSFILPDEDVARVVPYVHSQLGL